MNLPSNSLSKVVIPIPFLFLVWGSRVSRRNQPITIQSALFSQRPWWLTALPYRRPCSWDSMRPNHHQDGEKTPEKSPRRVLKSTGPGAIRLNQSVLCPAGTASYWRVCENWWSRYPAFGHRLTESRSGIFLVSRKFLC